MERGARHFTAAIFKPFHVTRVAAAGLPGWPDAAPKAQALLEQQAEHRRERPTVERTPPRGWRQRAEMSLLEAASLRQRVPGSAGHSRGTTVMPAPATHHDTAPAGGKGVV